MNRKNNSSSKGSINTTKRVPSDSEKIAPAYPKHSQGSRGKLSMPPCEIPSVPGHKTQAQRALDLACAKGILRPCDLEAIGIPRVVLTRLTASGQLDKIGRGLYRLPTAKISEHVDLETIGTKIPQAVFCLFTALRFHELTTQMPHQTWIAMPRGSHSPKIDYPPIKMVQYSGDAYGEGIEVHQRDQVQIRVYSAAKTIADCFKHRNKIGLDVALEALQEGWRYKRVDMNELWHFAKICRVANVMRPYMEAIV